MVLHPHLISLVPEKKNKLSAAVTGMKEVKILIRKLDIVSIQFDNWFSILILSVIICSLLSIVVICLSQEKFQTPVHISKLPSVCNSVNRPVNNQPVHDDNDRRPTSTASTDVKNKPSYENVGEHLNMYYSVIQPSSGMSDYFQSIKCKKNQPDFIKYRPN